MKRDIVLALILFIINSSIVFSQNEDSLFQKKSLELTEYIYEKVPNLNRGDESIIQEITYDYIKDLAELIKKVPDTRSQKFKDLYRYLNGNLRKDLAPSINARKGRGHNKTSQSKDMLKEKTLEILKEMGIEMSKRKNKKK